MRKRTVHIVIDLRLYLKPVPKLSVRNYHAYMCTTPPSHIWELALT